MITAECRSSSRVKSCFVKCVFNGFDVFAYIDSGAEVCLVNRRLVEGSFITPTKFSTVKGIGHDSHLSILGSVVFDFHINDLFLKAHTFLVVEDINFVFDILFGIDILDRFSLALDVASRRLTYSPQGEPLYSVPLVITNQPTVAAAVVLPKGCDVQPWTAQILEAEVRCSGGCAFGAGMFMPSPFHLDATQDRSLAALGVALARSVDSPRINKIFVQVANLSPDRVTLRRHMVLGTFVPIAADGLDSSVPSVFSLQSSEGESCREPFHFDLSDTALTDEQRAVAEQFLAGRSTFSVSDFDLGRVVGVSHCIEVSVDTPIKLHSRTFQGAVHAAVEAEIAMMRANDVIKEVQSLWSSPVVPVRKKDGGWRICVNYCGLNAVTKKDVFPLPHIDDTLAQIGNSRFFLS